jgi:hypothetical protein
MNGLLQLLLLNAQNYYKNNENINKNNEIYNIYNTVVTQSVIELTNKLTILIPSSTNVSIYITLNKINNQFKDIILNYFKLYINEVSDSINIVNSSKDSVWLLARWFIYSICDHFTYLNKANKYCKCVNNNKDIFI